ncbi:PepSY domain-containing protein [Amycolatopsis umgeniensis]|uniref:Putative membrane protein YkoI n=1 Tax=Amycolatopsis umgeniensis TaxID=336628 RepID=A0A841B4W0_9PSEU|nr:PepSY domain-containing protein [Amycolatopsis umgeniensis]MBB5853805.1 putative membrane protein YkoI [Amycolatopsis umgeniensis]
MRSSRLVAAGVLTLALAGCSTEPPPGPAAPAPDGGDAQPVKAIQAAAGAVPGGRVFDVEHADDGWEIKVASNGQEHKVRVSRDGGQVLGQQQTAKPSDDMAKVQQADVDAVKALQAAQKRLPGELDEMEIDLATDGTLVWQVGLRDGTGVEHDVDVDAKTGQVR